MSDYIANEPAPQATSWVYEGIWGLLTQIFCVPRNSPILPVQDTEQIVSRKPSLGFLNYLKLQLWAAVIVLGGGATVVSIVLAVSEDEYFLLLTAVIAMLTALVAACAYLALHLRYDTTWYVFSDRSMRLRRGIWIIRESTITFENIQNVKVEQGPLQRWFGIANVVVETAGGGGGHGEPGASMAMHSGVIEGVADAASIRDSIMGRVRLAGTTGLGDEASRPIAIHGWSREHLDVLSDIRDLAQAAAT